MSRGVRALVLAANLALLMTVPGCNHSSAERSSGDSAGGVTDIAIGTTVRQWPVKRLGMNLSGQSYYGSGQLLRNVTFRNPGFEGETWQSILRCKAVTATTCTDSNDWAVWPADFLKGAHFEFISGPAMGMAGTVLSSDTSVAGSHGITLTFAAGTGVPATNDFVLVKRDIPGNPMAGWWQQPPEKGATFTAETVDLSPHTPGKQALRITAAGPGQYASLHSYFDSLGGRPFLRMTGPYRLTFRAKGAGGNNQLAFSVARINTPAGNLPILPQRIIPLAPEWKDYSFDFTASEQAGIVGTLDLNFWAAGGNVLLDDVALTAGAAADNPTAFRNEVVSALRDLHPGVLRYMDSGTDFGSSIDNMIAPPFARLRAGMSTQATMQEDIPLGLHEFLQLCQAIDAEPWFTMPAGTSPAEAKNLIEYLGGPASTPYGAKRSALGQAAPWTSVFPAIHLELGNEQWNGPTFYGAAINDAVAYGRRAEQVFAGARSSPSYQPSKFDLVIGTQAVNPWLTQQELKNSGQYDTTAVAPYLFSEFDDASSDEAIFGPMFAEPEMIDSRPSGYMALQAKAAQGAARPAKLAVYEVNLGTVIGKAPQASIDAVIPSVGAGITVADHMLLMMRDLGITTQAIWSLPQYYFNNPADPDKKTWWLWGTVVDMGGGTDLRRPQFLAEQLANQAILPAMLATTVTGANPTWDQPLSSNGNIKLDGAHYLQTFAFANGPQHSLILINLSRDRGLPVTFSGASAPSGKVEISRLTSVNITDTNEKSDTVGISHKTVNGFDPKTPYIAAPFSMTVFQWSTAR